MSIRSSNVCCQQVQVLAVRLWASWQHFPKLLSKMLNRCSFRLCFTVYNSVDPRLSHDCEGGRPVWHRYARPISRLAEGAVREPV